MGSLSREQGFHDVSRYLHEAMLLFSAPAPVFSNHLCFGLCSPLPSYPPCTPISSSQAYYMCLQIKGVADLLHVENFISSC